MEMCVKKVKLSNFMLALWSLMTSGQNYAPPMYINFTNFVSFFYKLMNRKHILHELIFVSNLALSEFAF